MKSAIKASFKSMYSMVCALLWIATSACQSGSDAPEVRAVYDRLIQALESKDTTALWPLMLPDSRTRLLVLVERAREASAFAPSLWGGEQAPETVRARIALGQELIDAAGPDDEGRGPRLVAHLLRLDSLAWTEGSRESLKHPRIIIEAETPQRAVVRLPSGESLVFLQTADGWFSNLLAEAFLDTTIARGFEANLEKAFGLRDASLSAWKSDLDARTPQGAYNHLRSALKRSEGLDDALFSMLDDDTIASLQGALDAARRIQKRIQQGVARPQRSQAYATEGLDRFVDVRSDGELFGRWRTSHPLPEGLAVDEPARFEVESENAGVIVTAGGHRVPFRRRADGLWGLAWWTKKAQDDLVRPLETKLTVPGPATAPR